MAKLTLIFLFLISSFISCNKHNEKDEIVLTLKEYKHNRIYFEIKNTSQNIKKIFFNEVPNIYVNKKNVDFNDSVKPFSLIYCTENKIKMKVNVFSNKDFIDKVHNSLTTEVLVKPDEIFSCSILSDTLGDYSEFVPDLNGVKDVKLKVIYNGAKINRMSKIDNNPNYIEKNIISINEIKLR